MTSDVVTKIKQGRIIELLKANKRLDGRDLSDHRKIEVEIGFIETANGSALVSLGKTKVLVGIKIEIGEPFSDRPDDGVLTTNVELVPVAHPLFEPGPPREKAIELARVVDRGIRESKMIDLKKLCIIKGEKVFVVFIDIYVLNYDGNLFDASSLASVIALANAKMSKCEIEKDGGVKLLDEYDKLPVQNYPVSITVAVIDKMIVVDPSIDEERIADTLVTMTVDKGDQVCAIQKRGVGTLYLEEILQITDIVYEKSKKIRETIIGV
jgi:exosome complex component RRP42